MLATPGNTNTRLRRSNHPVHRNHKRTKLHLRSMPHLLSRSAPRIKKPWPIFMTIPPLRRLWCSHSDLSEGLESTFASAFEQNAGKYDFPPQRLPGKTFCEPPVHRPDASSLDVVTLPKRIQREHRANHRHMPTPVQTGEPIFLFDRSLMTSHDGFGTKPMATQ